MANIQTIETDGWFTRINYADGDVLDKRAQSENQAITEARAGSRNIRGDIDVCHGADVVATYRDGELVE